MKYVQCNRAGCGVRRVPSEMTTVRVVFDGTPLVGKACSPDHAEEIERGWRDAGPARPAPLPIPSQESAAVKAARRAVLAAA